MLIIFAENGAESGRRINATGPNRALPAIHLIDAAVVERPKLAPRLNDRDPDPRNDGL
jgi:hypothetical protein